MNKFSIVETANRPENNSFDGDVIIDKTIGQLLYKNNGAWYRQGQIRADVATYGPTANRPVAGNQLYNLKDTNIGYRYFDTDLGKPIYVKEFHPTTAVITWVDGAGNIV